jgi:hypothetical protein
LRQIPRLEAEESIRRSKEIAVGTGSLRNPRAVSDEWERLARLARLDEDSLARRKPPAMFSDEVLGRLPIVRVARKG